jgi:hypothetical protein
MWERQYHGPLSSPSMFLDTATLQNLDIVPLPTARGTTLWTLVDRTRTRVGSKHLRDRLFNPPHEVDTILALQRAHQELAADASAYRDALDRTEADEVERYLGVTCQLPRDMPPMLRFRKWYRPYLQDVERGRTFVKARGVRAASTLRLQPTHKRRTVLCPTRGPVQGPGD